MLRIALDMDEVLADTARAELAWLHQRYGSRWSPDALVGKQLADLLPPAHAAALDAVLHEGTFFADLPVMPGAVEVVARLVEHHQVFVVSAATEYPASCVPKFTWLRRHFPFIRPEQIVFCGDKTIVAADHLVDDNAHRFAGFRGELLLFDSPHNAGVQGYPRVRGWADVARRFLTAAP
jgi:5'(3')-deoxyribonucleotidase